MSAPSFLIRPPQSQEELIEHIQGYVEVAQSFSPDPLPKDTADRLLHKLTTMPGYRQEQVRSAYRDGEQLGGYRIYERKLRVGSARLVTGCIGGVYTRAEARNQGVATALMQDAIAYAQARRYPLLLLDGIPKFYQRYDFCDVYDLSTLELDRQAVMALPESQYTVRQSRIADAEGLLALYERHLGCYTGSFERSLEQQVHWMEHGGPEQLFVAVDLADRVKGYLYLAATQARGAFFLAGTQIWEMVAGDWPAAVALLQYHVELMEREGSRTEAGTAMYSVPPMSSLAYRLREHLEVMDISRWDMPVLGWAMREQTFRHRNAGWMARLVDLPELTRAMLQEWQARWRRSLAHWAGDISLVVGDKVFTLSLTGRDLQLQATTSSVADVLTLTPQAFTQLVFGVCPISSVLQQGEHRLGREVITALSILFPAGQEWIAGSDWF